MQSLGIFFTDLDVLFLLIVDRIHKLIDLSHEIRLDISLSESKILFEKVFPRLKTFTVLAKRLLVFLLFSKCLTSHFKIITLDTQKLVCFRDGCLHLRSSNFLEYFQRRVKSIATGPYHFIFIFWTIFGAPRNSEYLWCLSSSFPEFFILSRGPLFFMFLFKDHMQIGAYFMENFSVLDFSWYFSNIFDLIIESFLDEVNLFAFDILPENIYQL